MTARSEIEKHYNVDARGVIRSPGKFEGEPLFIPHYWDMGLEGFADDEFYIGEKPVWVFKVDSKDATEFPEMRSFGLRAGRKIYLWESDQGFVYWSNKKP